MPLSKGLCHSTDRSTDRSINFRGQGPSQLHSAERSLGSTKHELVEQILLILRNGVRFLFLFTRAGRPRVKEWGPFFLLFSFLFVSQISKACALDMMFNFVVNGLPWE